MTQPETENNEKTDPVPKVIKTALGLCLAVALGSLFFGRMAFAKGFLLGSLASILNFLLMKRGLQRRLGMNPKRVGVEAFFSIIVRYALLAIPIIIAVKVDRINVVGACIGIFNIQLSILFHFLLWEQFISRKSLLY
ncbi:MAG: ATP synthase subunit I [Deltaproteobacteria bacterium]|nr:ATP synthase subunit I [Deltaproteobacteria bacterium]